MQFHDGTLSTFKLTFGIAGLKKEAEPFSDVLVVGDGVPGGAAKSRRGGQRPVVQVSLLLDHKKMRFDEAQYVTIEQSTALDSIVCGYRRDGSAPGPSQLQ